VWKREEEQPVRPTPQGASSETVKAPAARSGRATIGPSIVIKGEVSGSEDLLIQGRVEGSVALALHAVTVGGGGRVKADISGRVITVEGDVEGDLEAEEQIVLRGSAKVEGDLRAPRVVLEDGASFRGMVDMGPRRGSEEEASGKPVAKPTSTAPGPPRALGDKGVQERKIGT
jgi:cytoskeletal protein CcmA (bactofilin family)